MFIFVRDLNLNDKNITLIRGQVKNGSQHLFSRLLTISILNYKLRTLGFVK